MKRLLLATTLIGLTLISSPTYAEGETVIRGLFTEYKTTKCYDWYVTYKEHYNGLTMVAEKYFITNELSKDEAMVLASDHYEQRELALEQLYKHKCVNGSE